MPRPDAEDEDQEAVDDVKKNVPAGLDEIVTPGLEQYSSLRYGTQEDRRLGLKTIPRRRRTLKKVKPLVKGPWPLKAFYL